MKKPKPKPAAASKAKKAPKPKLVKAVKAPKAGPTAKKKFKPVDEGNGTVMVALTDVEIRERGMELARQLHLREEEVDAQASTRSAMKARLDEFDNKIHRLQIAIREKREERPAPGLFDRFVEEKKALPLAKDTMKKPDEKPAEVTA